MGVLETYPVGRFDIASNTTTATVVAIPQNVSAVKVFVSTASYVGLGDSDTAPTIATQNQIQTLTITGTPTGGTFKLRDPLTKAETATIAHNASAANVKTALIAANMPFVTGDITAGGGALPGTAVTLQFTGSYAGYDLPQLIVSDNSLTGGTDVTIATTITQVARNRYGFMEANTQEIFQAGRPGLVANGGDRFLYVAAVSATGVARVTFYR